MEKSDVIAGYRRRGTRTCELCGTEVFADSFAHHVRGCLYRFEFDPQNCDDAEKVRVALRLTKEYYGQEIYEEAKKSFDNIDY